MPELERLAQELAACGLLTEQQACAWVYCQRGVDVETVAGRMDVSPSRVYNARSDAKRKLSAARETLEISDSIETRRSHPNA